jgi:hypothetical protein
MALIILLAGLVSPRFAQAQPAKLCFPDIPGIADCIEGRIREYWEQNGGLPVFGYPISAAAMEQTAEGAFLTQYFERNRFELHPDKARPYDVLLGRLGDDRLKQIGRVWQGFPKAQASAAHFFGETGHAIAHGPFWSYWSSHGLEFDGKAGKSFAESLALFGLPLSEPTTETNTSGDTALTQWFERARFEDHGARGVLLGLLGNETRKASAAPAPNGQGVQVLAKGFAQNGQQGGYGFTLRNNGTTAAQGVQYEVTAYDAAGAVVDTDSGELPVLFANETTGVGGDLYVQAEVRIARIEAQARVTGSPSPFAGLGANPLSGEDARYTPDPLAPKVTGAVRNRTDKNLTNIRVSAIAFDAGGAITGGGYGELDRAPANSALAVQVDLQSSAPPARVELYAHLTPKSQSGQ